MALGDTKASEKFVGATDQAQAGLRSNFIGPYARAAAGNRATYVEDGGVYAGKDLITGNQIQKVRGDVTFYTSQASNDPTLIAALATLANRESSPSAPLPPIDPVTGTATPAEKETSLATRITDAVKNGLKAITDFAVTKGEDGKTTINSGVWVILGIVAVVFVWRKFRRA